MDQHTITIHHGEPKSSLTELLIEQIAFVRKGTTIYPTYQLKTHTGFFNSQVCKSGQSFVIATDQVINRRQFGRWRYA
jgi:hypothetical protein